MADGGRLATVVGSDEGGLLLARPAGIRCRGAAMALGVSAPLPQKRVAFSMQAF
jgi:hypothetical protein